MIHTEITPTELADRVGIRELVDACADGADRRGFTEDGERKLILAWLRSGDTFVKVDNTWLFAERNLCVDWTGRRASHH
jgi:hypothetical protein